jgi:hypothetical protein
MVIAKRARSKPPKRERIKAHIEELKRLVVSKHPEARFDVGPVPDIRWPGLYVYASINGDQEDELQDFISQAQERFFEGEWMTVFVFVRQPSGADK